jgi:[ribosomal protein S18]-alanine N-acetyltransferase
LKGKFPAHLSPVKPGQGWFREYNGDVQFSLRDFRSQDFETLWRIDQQCFAPGISYSRVELAEYLRRPGAFGLVAESSNGRAAGNEAGPSGKFLRPADPSSVASSSVDASILGFIVAEPGSRKAGHIITIDVLPQARQAGVGSRLLQSAEKRLRAAGCDSVILETAIDNRTALAFYTAHQYNVMRTIPGYYSDGVDALVLKKEF